MSHNATPTMIKAKEIYKFRDSTMSSTIFNKGEISLLVKSFKSLHIIKHLNVKYDCSNLNTLKWIYNAKTKPLKRSFDLEQAQKIIIG